MKRRDFIGGLSCIVAGFVAGATKKSHKNYEIKTTKKEDYIYENRDLNEIYLELTSHCNLNCKSCDAFAPLGKKELMSYEQFVEDFKKIKEFYPSNKMDIVFLGGEPLLHPEIKKFMTTVCEFYPQGNRSLFTNAILLNDMDDEFWDILKQNNISLHITKYPININRSIYEQKAKEKGIYIAYDYIISENIYDLNTKKSVEKNIIERTYPGCMHGWGKPIIDLSGQQDYVEKKYNCKHKTNSHSYKNGNLYYCTVHAHFDSFIEYFNLDLKINKEDYLKIAELTNKEQIKEFLNTPNKLCRYCKQCHTICFNGKAQEWGFSERKLSEWT